MDHEHRPVGVGDLLGECVEALVQLVLGYLSRGVPRGVVRPSVRQQLQTARHVQHLAVGVDRRELRPVEDRVDREVVVVAGDQVERHGRIGQPLRGELHPRLHALVHQPVQQGIAFDGVSDQAVGLLLRRDERVVADVGDVAFELDQLLVVLGRPVDAEQLGLIAAVGACDGDDRLARQVSGEQGDVCLVDVQPDRVQVLPPRLLGRVEVAGDVDPGIRQEVVDSSLAGSRRTASSDRRPSCGGTGSSPRRSPGR